MKHLINEHIRALNPPKTDLLNHDKGVFLDKSELPYAPSPLVIQEMIKTATTVNRYPEILHHSLRAAIANYTNSRKEQIFVGNGSDAIIELLLRIFVKFGENVLIPIPTFFVYQYATKIVGGNPILVNRLDDFGLDVPSLLQKVTPEVKLIFIANPNNPTANSVSREIILNILNEVDCIVVVDECYYEFCQETVIDLVDQYPNLVVLRSFSKSFGLAGLRVGYGIANETIVDYLYRVAKPFSVNAIALAAATTAIKDIDYVNFNIQKICQEREIMAQNLAQLGCFVYPSSTNFLFIGTHSLGIPSRQLVQSLQDKQIFVQDCGLQAGLDEYFFKVSIGTPANNQALIKGMEDIIQIRPNQTTTLGGN
jgi:histidinol-phosphate aminotransferase